MIKNLILLVVVLLLISSCASNPEPPVVSEALGKVWEQEVIKWIADSKRISTVSSKIFVEGREYCEKLNYLGAYVGIKVWSKHNFEEKWHKQALEKFSLNDEVRILHIAPDSPAAVAGFQVGDIILKINSKPIPHQGIFRLESSNKDNIAKSTTYSLRRGAQFLVLNVEPQPACEGEVYLVTEDSKSFQNDGSNIMISTGMMSVINSEEEIALIVSHELAHNARKHQVENERLGFWGWLFGSAIDGIVDGWGEKITKGRGYTDADPDTKGAEGLENIFGKRSAAQEQQADSDTLYLMAIAGFNIDQAAMKWRKLEESIDPLESDTFRYYHPYIQNKYSDMEKIKNEIENKRQAGKVLTP